ncbi:MAG: hypothetical protein Q4C53_04130 [Clostridia bacterium]|nr:hypothetical protein [Clostridia bacterium]
MFTAILLVLFLGGALSLAFRLTGALIAALLWLFVKIPLALVFWVLGLALCCTLILIPLGLRCLGLGTRLFIPGI